jgi:hypothetical protein
MSLNGLALRPQASVPDDTDMSPLTSDEPPFDLHDWTGRPPSPLTSAPLWIVLVASACTFVCHTRSAGEGSPRYQSYFTSAYGCASGHRNESLEEGNDLLYDQYVTAVFLHAYSVSQYRIASQWYSRGALERRQMKLEILPAGARVHARPLDCLETTWSSVSKLEIWDGP